MDHWRWTVGVWSAVRESNLRPARTSESPRMGERAAVRHSDAAGRERALSAVGKSAVTEGHQPSSFHNITETCHASAEQAEAHYRIAGPLTCDPGGLRQPVFGPLAAPRCWPVKPKPWTGSLHPSTAELNRKPLAHTEPTMGRRADGRGGRRKAVQWWPNPCPSPGTTSPVKKA